VSEKWYFLFTGAYWRRTLECCLGPVERSVEEQYGIPLVGAAEGADAGLPHIEPVHPSLHAKVGIRIKNLVKQFDHTGDKVSTLTKLCMSEKDKKSFTAVDKINMDMYVGQITCLLGHNGAGKTVRLKSEVE
jgi:ABC-type glutathione transport system ATPase component